MHRLGFFVFVFLLLIQQISLRAQRHEQIWSASISQVSTFSSPRAQDLNGDGVKEIVIGAGIEEEGSPKGIFAFDGVDGSVLWQRYARNQIYGSPIFQDINLDGTPDVFITGRDAQFLALDGSNGNLLWQFWSDTRGAARDSGWYNFYLPQWIPDQNQDGYLDIIVSNGGDARIAPADRNRPAGYLMALSGLDGSILQVDTMPDGKETYHSPLVIDFYQNGKLQILFGSGGETVGGSFFQVGLNEFMNSGLTQAQVLLTNSQEGYIAVASLADLNQNGTPDIVVPQLNEHIIALEGGSGLELWRYREPGTDCYVSPTIGQFTGDATPDVFTVAAVGNWPFYQRTIKLLIDGSNGELVWSEVGFPYQLTQGIAMDWDQDGFDELLFPKNEKIGDTALVNRLFLYDFNDKTVMPYDQQREGAMVFSVPLLEDLDGDRSLDLVFATHDNQKDWYQPDGFSLYRLELGFQRKRIAWGGYLGTKGDGVYNMNLEVSVEYPLSREALRAYPNPVRQVLYFQSPRQSPIQRIDIYDALGHLLISTVNREEIYVGNLERGIYYYQVQLDGQMAGGQIIKR